MNSENINLKGNQAHSDSQVLPIKPKDKVSFESIFESKVSKKQDHVHTEKESPEANTEHLQEQTMKKWREEFTAIPSTQIYYETKTECIQTIEQDIKKAFNETDIQKNIEIKSSFGKEMGQLLILVEKTANQNFKICLKPCNTMIQNIGAHLLELEKKLKEKYKIENFEIIKEEDI